MADHFGQQAVVIGGSLAGLMTARLLADHFDTVTIFERDHIENRPALHQSIPQGNHLHGLLLGGQQVMAALYPGFVETLDPGRPAGFRLSPDARRTSAEPGGGGTVLRGRGCPHRRRRRGPPTRDRSVQSGQATLGLEEGTLAESRGGPTHASLAGAWGRCHWDGLHKHECKYGKAMA